MKKNMNWILLTTVVLFFILFPKISLANENPNLLVDKKVTYSGVEGGKKADGNWVYPQFIGENIVDGSSTTRWSADKTDYQWIIVDMGEKQLVSEIFINFHATCPQYEVLVSVDGDAYHSVYKTTSAEEGIAKKQHIYMDQTEVRYIKFEQQKMWKHATNNQFYGVSLIAVEAYEKRQELESLQIDQEDLEISLGRTTQLTYSIEPKDLSVPEHELLWETSDHKVVTVENGVLKANGIGSAVISLKIAGVDLIAYSHVTVVPEKSEFVIMRNRWKNRLLGDNYDANDPDIQKYLNTVSDRSEILWMSLNKSETRDYLWERVPSDTISADYTTQFEKIKALTLGYYLPGSKIYKNKEVKEEIMKAISFMIDEKKYNGVYYTGNWWDWQIGCAQPLVDTLILLHDDLFEENYPLLEKFVYPITKYANDPNKQWPNATASGANLTDIAISVLGSAILLEDTDRMELVQKNVPKVLIQVTKGDGLYQDGSLVQHSYFPYNGSYGNELLKGVGRIQSILSESQWEIKDDNINHLFNVIDKGYLELMYTGKMPAMVSGRSMTRAPGQNPFTTELETGKETMANLTLIAKFAPDHLKTKIYEHIKAWISSEENSFNFYANPRDFEALLDLKEIVNDEDIVANETLETINVYASMDRVFQKNFDYAVGISMYSNRIANFESINTENKKGWHTADGMVYLYNQDLNQFDEGYWATIDPYRLPGTTVDTKILPDSANNSKKSPQNWVGGATNKQVAAVGMILDKSNEGMNLKGKKSWFLLDGQIVCLGAGITGDTTETIETILENRLLSEDDKITASSNRTVSSEPTEIKNWVNIESKNKKNNIGYIFTDNSVAYIDKRTGKYHDINEYFVNDLTYDKTYFTLIKNHGKEVVNAAYEYTIVPGKASEDIQRIFEQPEHTVVMNSESVQSVTSETTLLINSFDNNQKIDYLKIVNPMSLIVQAKGNNIYELTLSNPKQDNKVISLDFEKGIDHVISGEDFVVEGNNISLDTTNLFGQSKTIIIQAKIDKSRLEKLVNENNERDETLYTENSWKIFKKALDEAWSVLADENVSQSQIDKSYDQLMEGIGQLEEKVGSEELQLSVNDLEILKKGKTLKVSVVSNLTKEELETIQWEVQNETIASINLSGLVTAKKAGTTRITAKTNDGKTATFTLRVSN